MIKNYLTNITPDSFSGMIFAVEGIKNGVVLLNGPTGCKFYHGAISAYQGLAQKEFDAMSYSDLWLFGQARVPCTYLDKRDYVYGSQSKIVDGIKYIKDTFDCEFLAVINSPGAALIGDDLEGIAEMFPEDMPIVAMETSGYSKMIWEGYSEISVEIIKKLAVKKAELITNREENRKKVNLLGLSIFHKYYRGDVQEFQRMLGLCGIELNCALGAGASVDEIKNMGQAELNIVLYKDYGLESAKILEEIYGTPYYVCDGLPIGFSQTEIMFEEICRILDCDYQRFREYAEKARGDAYIHLSRLNSLTGLPKGTKFAVHGTATECLSYSRFFIKYFGMVAECISAIGDEAGNYKESNEYKALESLLNCYDMGDVLKGDILMSRADLVFANGDIIAQLKARKHNFSGIETGLPTLGYMDVILKTHLGIHGSLHLCEQVINGIMF